MQEHRIEGLSEKELSEVVATFPALARLAANGRSRELLRRLVVVDLLVRSRLAGVPLSDVEAMHEIWKGLVRIHERQERGSPDAREHALLRIAQNELAPRDPIHVLGELDADAIAGLRRDGLVRAATGSAWEILPQFAHDEIRRYAVARALLTDGGPAARLTATGAPRWALPAARLACQAQLSAPPNQESLGSQFHRLQAEFDALVEAGYGARWGDVPTEALLTIADPTPLLREVWPYLETDDHFGLRRLLRLLHQRHRSENGIVNVVVAEPVVDRLLDDRRLWRTNEAAAEALRQWLQALVLHDTPKEAPLRVRLRQQLVEEALAAEARLAERQAAAATALAARTPEQIHADEKRAAQSLLFAEMGISGRRRRRDRPDVPREITDDTFLELLALLGPDVGEEGERVLRRVAEAAPWYLRPAIEELLTGRALATYGRGLISFLTEAYYLDEEDDGSSFHDDGIRRHRWRVSVTPLHAWYRGPFFWLFQADFAAGVAVLNRMLNHAAKTRCRILASLGSPWGHVPEDALDGCKLELAITGSPSADYYGDAQTWFWYRGTGVGPYPCMSALQALERVCDQLLHAGAPPDRLVAMLLNGCQNLAMPGMVAGLLTRHLERAGMLLDPFLVEPRIWELEFARCVSESSGLAASSEGIFNPERRTWSMREASTWLVIHADAERAAELRSIGEQLVAQAERLASADIIETENDAEDGDSDGAVTYVTTVRNWASALDRGAYAVHEEDGAVYIQSSPPADVQAALESGNDDLLRGQEAVRLVWKYLTEPRAHPERAVTFSQEELVHDLATARSLHDDPPALSATGKWDAPIAVAAAALRAHFTGGVDLPSDGIQFAVDTVFAVAEGADPSDDLESSESYFEQGSDRVAASVVPLLLLPQAEELVAADGQPLAPRGRVVDAARRLAQAVPHETRLHLARGLDPLWKTPCGGQPCHHEDCLRIAVETLRDCVFGEWDASTGSRRLQPVDDPVEQSLRDVADDAIYVAKLDPAIRAMAVGATSSSACVSERVHAVLIALLDAHRRGMLAHEEDYDHRGSHALVVARATLSLAVAGDPGPIHEHVAALADRGEFLSSFQHALAAVAEENDAFADAANRYWPRVIRQVLDLRSAGRAAFDDRHYGATCLAALMPRPMADWLYLYREIESTPRVWADVEAWRTDVDAWVPHALGQPECVDSLIGLLLTSLPLRDQARLGLSWISTIALADVDAAATRSWLIAPWLIDIRAAATDIGSGPIWQALVDALVVAGQNRLAPYSE